MYLFNIRRKHVDGGTITKRSVEDADVSLSVTSAPYTGEPITPSVNVIVGSTLLSPNVDFTIKYIDNVEVGLATVTIMGTGNYYGEKSVYFYITSGAKPSGSWDFDITKSSVGGQKDMTSLSSSFRSINILPVRKDGKDTILCSHGTSYYLSLLSWDGSSAGSISVVDGTSHASGFEHGGTTADGIRFTFPNYGQNGMVYYQDVSTDMDVLQLNRDSADSVVGVGSGSMWPAPFYGFSIDGTVFYRVLSYGSSYSVLTVGLAVPFRIESFIAESMKTGAVPAIAFRFSPDGKSAVSVETSGNTYFVKYSLSTAFDFSTAKEDGRFSIGATKHPLFDIDAAGTKIVAVGSDNHTFFVYDLSR